jgi:hypothetical protein
MFCYCSEGFGLFLIVGIKRPRVRVDGVTFGTFHGRLAKTSPSVDGVTFVTFGGRQLNAPPAMNGVTFVTFRHPLRSCRVGFELVENPYRDTMGGPSIR